MLSFITELLFYRWINMGVVLYSGLYGSALTPAQAWQTFLQKYQ
jgi:hypothetical protein